jgi:hypothetical protein
MLEGGVLGVFFFVVGRGRCKDKNDPKTQIQIFKEYIGPPGFGYPIDRRTHSPPTHFKNLVKDPLATI